MALLFYNLLLFLFSPLIYLYLLRRLAIGKEDRAHWRERWGRLPDTVQRSVGGPRIWVHAVSVGEVMAAAPVLRELRGRLPNAFILLTTTTPGGRTVALKQCPPADAIAYYPLDFAPIVARALRIARPDVVLLMEWEIWPNFLATAKKRGARIAVLNGRISDRGMRRGTRSRFFTRPGLDAVDRFAMQSDEDGRRAADVGAAPDRIAILGNTKFDESTTPLDPDERAAVRADLGIASGVPIIVCGSTRPGEEEIIADAALQIWNSQPAVCLIVAPRHLDRADEAAAIFAARGATVSRRTGKDREPDGVSMDRRVIILDTFGELGRVYAVAEAAFVGGSLLPFGGQSVFQPLAQGVPALFGPFMNNQRDITALALRDGVGFEVSDAASLAVTMLRVLDLAAPEKAALSERARALIKRNQGASARCVNLTLEFLNC